MGELSQVRPREPEAGTLDIQVLPEHGGCRIAVRGEIDLATVASLETQIDQHAGQPIMLDLSGVSFIDSMGLTLLIRRASELVVAAASAEVERLIRVCGLEGVLRYQ
jgi:anti-anti-sigma factor